MKLDADENPRTVSAYRVQSLPTWLVFKDAKPADAKVSDAELATLTPDATARIHLAEVLGQADACPWWAGQASSPGPNGRLRQRKERGVCRQMQNHWPQEMRCR